MDTRKREVLRAVVDDYVRTAEPVASGTLARKYPLGVSPATIRNELSDLEAEGYLRQPHVSAGRIPSDKGYRFYVDELVSQRSPTLEERRRLERIVSRPAAQTSWLFGELARLLAEATQYASVTIGPVKGPAVVAGLRAIPIEPGRCVLLLVTDQDFVAHRTVDLPEGLGSEDVEALVARIARALVGTVLTRVGRTLWREVQEAGNPYRSVAEATIDLLEDVAQAMDERVFLGGASKLLGLPEFAAADRVRELLEFLDHPDRVQSLFDGSDSDVRVRIGHENHEGVLQEFSVVTAHLEALGRNGAYVAVIGPTRMMYDRVLGILETLEALTGTFE